MDDSRQVVKEKKRCYPLLLSRYHVENTSETSSTSLQAGIDEVARGCLFGPVYSAAVILNPNVPLHEWLYDSKKVTPKRRSVVRRWIEETALAWSVSSVDNVTIDRIRIGNATMKAMNEAVKGLSVVPEMLLVDGDYFRADEGVSDIPHVTLVGGDATFANIAAASILAKEHHDEYIRSLIAEDPSLHIRYDLSNNVGYGTPRHIQGIKTYGPTPQHRKSFLRNIVSLPSIGRTFLERDDI
jgi:ribonuclease HII